MNEHLICKSVLKGDDSPFGINLIVCAVNFVNFELFGLENIILREVFYFYQREIKAQQTAYMICIYSS